MPRRPLTDKQREILQAERSHRRMQADVTTQLAQRETTHQRTRVATESELGGTRRKRVLVNRVQDKVIDTATPSSDSGLIMTVVFTIVGLALFYQVVTKAGQFSDLVNRTGDFLHKISSTTPLFQVVAK